MVEYKPMEINGDIPKYLKLIMVFIDRVGFPVLAFILMFIMASVSLQKATDAIQDNTKALVTLCAMSGEFQSEVKLSHRERNSKLDAISLSLQQRNYSVNHQ